MIDKATFEAKLAERNNIISNDLKDDVLKIIEKFNHNFETIKSIEDEGSIDHYDCNDIRKVMKEIRKDDQFRNLKYSCRFYVFDKPYFSVLTFRKNPPIKLTDRIHIYLKDRQWYE